MRKLCPGGMDLSTAYQYCVKPDLKCKVTGTVCYKYEICPVGGQGEPPPPFVGQQNIPDINLNVIGGGGPNSQPKSRCWTDHIYRAIVCCEYICK